MKHVLGTMIVAVTLVGCSSSVATPSSSVRQTPVASTATSVASPPAAAAGCHADLSGDLTRSLDEASAPIDKNSYWWPYDATTPGTAAFGVQCDLIGFRLTNGTTTAQFPRGPGHYVIVDFSKHPAGGGSDDGFAGLDSGPGMFDMKIDVSLTSGALPTAYVVGTPGSLDITSFDQTSVSGTFSVTLNALPNGHPPVDTTKSIKVTGRFTAACSPKGDPVHGDTSKDCK